MASGTENNKKRAQIASRHISNFEDSIVYITFSQLNSIETQISLQQSQQHFTALTYMASTSLGGSLPEDGEEILLQLQDQLQDLVRTHCNLYLNEIHLLKVRVKELEEEKGALVAKLHKWKKGLGEWVERTLRRYGGKINPSDLPDLNEGSPQSSSSQYQNSSHSAIPESLPDSGSLTRKPPSSQESAETMIGSTGIHHDYDVGLAGLSYEENLGDMRVNCGNRNMGRGTRGRGDGKVAGEVERRAADNAVCEEVGVGVGALGVVSARRVPPANPYTTSSRPPSNFNSNPYAKTGGTKFKEVVRGKEARRRMHGQNCEECRIFFEAVAKDSNGVFDADVMVQSCSRHKTSWKNATQTPPDFWEMDFIDERENEEKEGNRFRKAGEGVVLETPVKQHPFSKRKSRDSSSEKKRKQRKTHRVESKRMQFTADSQEEH